MTFAKTPAYAFGFNEHTEALASFYPLLGIVDEFSEADTICNLPRLALDDLKPELPIINCVYNSRAYQAQKRLNSLHAEKVIFVGDIIRAYPEKFRGCMLAEAYLGIQRDYDYLKSLVNDFSDSVSQEQYCAILDFRRTLDIACLADFEVRIDEQYFENFLLAKEYYSLIDGGAFDGSDSLRFTQCFPNYHSVKVVEPCALNRSLISKKLAGLRAINVLPACLGDRCDVVQFAGTGTSAKIVDSGGEKVQMTTIDQLLTEQRTLVKLDIEGAEMMALNGATKALRSAKVGFAVSAYHLPHDFVDILQWMRSAPVEREYYFRHYSGGIAESVIFAV